MKIYLTSNRKTFNATADYNPKTKTITINKGSTIRAKVSESKTFKYGKKNTELRESAVKDNVLVKNITFSSASTSAAFVTGRSCNGLRLWKTKDGKFLGDVIEK